MEKKTKQDLLDRRVKKGCRVGDPYERAKERIDTVPLNPSKNKERRQKLYKKRGRKREKVSGGRAFRDFWISASLVTREAKTVGQVASRRKGKRGRGVAEGRVREEIEYPTVNPFNPLFLAF